MSLSTSSYKEMLFWFICQAFFFKEFLSLKKFKKIFFSNLFILFIYFWLRRAFVAARGPSLVAASGGHSSLQRAGATLCCDVWTSHRRGLSCCGAQALGTRAPAAVVCALSSCGSWAPECRLSSCGTRAYLLHGMWDLPRRGIEPVSPTLAGGLPTTVPPGKPRHVFQLTSLKFYIYSSEKCFTLIIHLVQIFEIHLPCWFWPYGHRQTCQELQGFKPSNFTCQPFHHAVGTHGRQFKVKALFFIAATHLHFLALLSFLMIQKIDTVANLLPAVFCESWWYYIII